MEYRAMRAMVHLVGRPRQSPTGLRGGGRMGIPDRCDHLCSGMLRLPCLLCALPTLTYSMTT